MAEEVKEMSESEKKKEDWMNSKWRPMMGWSYMLTCVADFVIFPVLWSVLQAMSKGQVNVQWQPITLQGAGLYHIAMGAVLGIAAYGRTQEKLGGANNGGITLPSNVGTTYQPPAPVGQPAAGAFGSPAPVTNSWGSQPLGSGSGFGSAPSTAASGGFGNNSGFGGSPQVVTGFGGKPGPMQPPDPVI
jgi:hypothetical protein